MFDNTYREGAALIDSPDEVKDSEFESDDPPLIPRGMTRWPLPEPMRLALDEAARAAGEGEVPIGAAVVKDGKVIATAHNRPRGLCDPTAHAEVLAIRRS